MTSQINYNLAGAETARTVNLSTDGARRVNTGFFVQADSTLTTRLRATGGARIDFVSSRNRGGFFGDKSISHQAGSGFAALTIGPFDGVSFTGQVSRGFRDPTLSDRFYRGPSGRGFITGNPDLEPETSLQVDLGMRYTTERLRVPVQSNTTVSVESCCGQWPGDQESLVIGGSVAPRSCRGGSATNWASADAQIGALARLSPFEAVRRVSRCDAVSYLP